ncbi:MAG: AI-2E family transporter [Salegentibacter sp.]|uniref:AI-2E family transporter n=1 Tax=Salegentibacter sp. TaxID=1903072 RepID=UPI0028708829|nr:AI-2E family transporter [Salegentibacter sp.]MDR9457195.1 AI-2E family transporter [Salegentibacter sp.]
MIKSHEKLLFPLVAIIIGSYFFFNGLVEAKVFLGPLVIAIILALLLIPLGNLLEKGPLNRSVSSLLSTILLFIVSLGVFALISLQIKSFVDDWDKITETMKPKVEQFTAYIYEHTPVSKEDFDKYREENDIGSMVTSMDSGKRAFNFFNSVMSFISNYLLTFIYIFFLLNYRSRFKKFILKLFSDEKKEEVKEIITETAHIGQYYLRGKLILISLLSVFYSIGLGVSGVDNFILISILAAFLTLIPFIGNIIGMGLAVIFGYLTQGETGILIGIVITFTIVQFIESYILEPYIVGDKVDIHPFFVILAIILGNMVWGVMGMILAIPVLGILNVVFNNVPAMKPFGYLLSTDSKQGDSQ